VSITEECLFCATEIDTLLSVPVSVAFVGHRHVPSAANLHILVIAHSLLLDLKYGSLPTQLRESDITLGQFYQALKIHLFGY